MIRKYVFGIMLLIFWVDFSGCSGKERANNPDQKAAGRPPVAVEVANAEVVEFTDGIDVVGSLSPKFSADVKSEFVGIVTEVYVTEWVRIKKGVPLAKIDAREMEIVLQRSRAAMETARATLLQTEVANSRAIREYERLLKLKEYGLVTQQSLDDGLTEKEASAAKIEAARAQLRAAEEDFNHIQTRLSKLTIYSPMDGVVSLRNVNVGDLVGEAGGKAMFRIINTRKLDLTVTVPSTEMETVHIGQSLTFSTDAIRDRAFTGKVMFINPVVNEADRSVKVIAEVDNVLEQLKGGLYVKGRIITGKRTGILRVPRTALLSWDVAEKKGDVFVVQGEIANRRAVRTGTVMGNFVQVTSGLSPGQPVVVRGGFNLKEGDRVNITPEKGG